MERNLHELEPVESDHSLGKAVGTIVLIFGIAVAVAVFDVACLR